MYEDEHAWWDDHDAELRAREQDRADRQQDFAPQTDNPFANPYRTAFHRLCDLIEERTQPNSSLRIHSTRLRRQLERDAGNLPGEVLQRLAEQEAGRI